ncbi:MAG: hypothetical protein NDI69_08505 [Bacteriovoracaceae bacterium]|nr:hypothetical protein [Bacteriovoracaceae bacterium]
MSDPKEVKDWDLKFEDPEDDKAEVPAEKSEDPTKTRLPSEKVSAAA